MMSALKRKPARHLAHAVLGLALLGLMLNQMPIDAHADATAQTYICGTPQSNHCYGQTAWAGGNYGLWTDIWVTPISCNGVLCATTGFVDDEAWLTNADASNWVEAGYTTIPVLNVNSDAIFDFTSSQVYFWADQRPGAGFYVDLLGAVPGQDYGEYTHTVILANDPSSQSFNVIMWSESGATNYWFESFPNSMPVGQIIVGQELAGLGGAYADRAYFSHNAFATAPLANNTFYGVFQSTDGVVTSLNPPYGSWYVHPGYSLPGGEFTTSCC
jgi:hypothetical protein